MNDCVNAEIRDRLPELASGTLADEEKTVVSAHLEICADCRAELELIRAMRTMFSRETPTIGIERISASIPAYRPARRRPIGGQFLRAAAAVILVVGGSASLALLSRHRSVGIRSSADSERLVAIGASAPAELELTGRIEDLTPGQLAVLLSKVDQLDAVPSTEPDEADVTGAVLGAVDTADVIEAAGGRLQ